MTRMYKVACLLGLSLLLGGCCTQNKDSKDVIGKQDVVVKDGILTPEILWAMGRLGEVTASPDGQHIAYSVRYYSVEENKGNTDLYLSDIDGKNVRQITHTPGSEYNLVWLDNHTVAYLAPGKDGMQLYGLDLTKAMPMQAEGRDIAPAWKKLCPVQLTRIEGGMEGFKLSPDKSRIAFIRQVQVLPSAQDLYADMDKSSGMVFNDLNYRHWDHWKNTISHVFISELSGGLNGKLRMCTASQPIDILENEPFESPLSPFGGIEQFDWSPDGQHLAFVTKESTGREYAFSTNSDVFIYDVENRVRHNVSDGNMGYDWNLVFSPHGRWLAWESMEREGYESDRIRIILLDL
ncbi:MAG: peptidase S9, partial [Bacteroidales bacterium]|nr:peptidase S9 [Bacteroidales bacterium]